MESKKYGLQLRIPPQRQSKKPTATKPVLPPSALGFGADDDEDDVEREIARQAAKKRSLREVEEKHRKALEEDPTAFDYDGVYDQMKETIARPLVQDRTERKSKYIERLMDKAKQRQMEQEVIYEKKIVKERSKEDHLYQNKEKFVTSAYKKKLEEQKKWMEEEHMRQLLEEREDVTKRSVTDFYFNIDKNVALGARGACSSNSENSSHGKIGGDAGEREKSGKANEHFGAESAAVATPSIGQSVITKQEETAMHPSDDVPKPTSAAGEEVKDAAQQESREQHIEQEQRNEKSYKRSSDAVAAARERYLARKKGKDQQ